MHLSKARWLRKLGFFGNSGSELGSSTQVQMLGVGLRHGKAGLEDGLRYGKAGLKGQARRLRARSLGGNHALP